MKFKKALSGTLAGAVVFGSLGIMPIASAEETAVPVISVTFDEGGDAYTLHGGTLAASGGGNALSLNGDGQYADINGIADTLAQLGDTFTMSVLFKPETSTMWARILDFGNGESGTYAFLTANAETGTPRFAVTTSGNGSEQRANSSAAVDVGEWHSIMISRDGDTTTFYVDGEVTGTTTDLQMTFSDIGKMDNYYIGKSQFAADPYYSGLIDDIYFYDSALGADSAKAFADEAESRNDEELVAQYNCYVIDSHAYDSDGETFSIENDDASDTEMYADSRSIADGTASFTLHGAQGEDVSKLTAYAASYDESGALTGVTAKTFTADEITSDEQPISFTYNANGAYSKLFIWNDMTPIPNHDLRLVTNVKNYTASEGSVTAAAYAVSADGKETKLAESQPLTLGTTEEGSTEMTLSDIPDGTEKVTVKVTVPDGDETADYTAGEYYVGLHSPVAAPADSAVTTDGAHDPSIVKFPGDDNYYVYSSHHLIFESKDLVNWTKYDFTNLTVQNITPKTYAFISNNIDSNVNATYWAPDVIYREGDEHPYWMYISVSCDIGGRNSAIALMKSDSPLFWADPDADIVDAGVVFATKEDSSYVTNAIDAHIYTDSNNGQQYFVWGSFWGGIQAAKLTDDGFVEDVDYSSDSSILSSCADINNTIYSQKNGTAGPEGAWMIEHDGYRYCFTSYGWLGSNYNTRVARSSLDTSFGSSTLTDANNRNMANERDKGSNSLPSGYKLIGSYRLGDGTYTISGDDNDYYIVRGSDDAHVYYGPGHNSAITAENGETFYVSHTRKDVVEIPATLQVRKMLWTEDGWPIVSPVTYAGEVEQALPEDMIIGTYDLASVGQTKMAENTIKARNFDLPVLSTKITLNADKSITNENGTNIGSWTFDNDHKVTLTFTADGNEAIDAFYNSDDVMTMYALFGYDKDEAEPVVALTGTDQNHITQFAKKSLSNSVTTDPSAISDTEPVSVEKSAGGNPELGFDVDGNLLYAGDPAATVIGDTVYLIGGHDVSTNNSYNIPEWVMYSSKDMKTWTYEGPIMSARDISWRSDNTSAWASQMVEYNGKYYFYFCTWDKNADGRQSIGVAVADKPTGPYKPMDTPLVSGSFTTPETQSHDDIDPTVLITKDEDGTEHRYLAWGNTRYYICELNEDMTSVKDITGDGEVVMHEDVLERKIKSAPDSYTEAPWLYERDGKYYLFYAMGWREQMAYAMADDPMGRYDYVQTLMPPTATSNTNHPSVIDFNGKTYFIYHNGALTNGSGYRRSICIQELTFDENGYVYPLSETSIGLTGTASVITDADGKYLGHNGAVNPSADASYPLSMTINTYDSEDGYNTAWEIMNAKYVPEGEDGAYYVSIQSVNKPGLYIMADDGRVVLTQDNYGIFWRQMTFKTVKAVNDAENMVSFESVSEPGKFLTVSGGALTLSYGTDPDACAFGIGAATQQDVHEIDPAEKEPDPVAEPDITQNFDNEATGTLISLQTTDTPPYTAIEGVTLYIGTRTGGADSGQNFAIQTGGITGNALVLNAGKYQSASRGPRLAINTPAIPYGCTVTASIMVKQGTADSVLRYNDSTSNETGTDISGVSTDWKEFKVSITNDNDTFRRTITFDGAVIAQDYADTFPVLWGTTVNETGQSIYFDDLSVTTTTESGETPDIPEVTLPDPAAYYSFDETLEDSVSGETATLTASDVTQAAEEGAAPVYVDGNDGTKAVSFSGADSYGLALPTAPDDGTFTISFDAMANDATDSTPYVFMANYDGDELKGGKDNAEWASVMVKGWWQSGIDDAPTIWSLDTDSSAADKQPQVSADDNNSLSLGTWHKITLAVNGDTCTVYVDGRQIASGAFVYVPDSTARVFVGANAWDTPLNGAIDNLYIFNEALTADQIKLIGAEAAE